MDPLLATLLATLTLAQPASQPDKKPPTPAPPAEPAKEEQPTKSTASAVPIAFPHPLITEILYAVPNTPEGDANQDGTRHVSGDEFVELVNPHDKPIQLFGYTLTDRNPANKGQFKFTFPALELPPGGVVVVFNGFEQTWSGVGPVGDARKAPSAPNESFHNAYVFTARAASSKTSWANAGDYVLLSDPNSAPIHCVTWGSFKEKVPSATLVETAPVTPKASVQRESVAGGFGIHPTAETDPKVAFSPGKFDVTPPPKPETPAGKPDAEKNEKPAKKPPAKDKK